jgi:lipoprotein NlpD
MIVSSVLVLNGCHHYTPAPSIIAQAHKNGFYHQVAPGETLFSVARLYDRDVNLIAQLNNVKDPISLPVGMRLFIPPSDFYPFCREVPPPATLSQTESRSSRPDAAPRTGAASSARKEEDDLKRATKLKWDVKQGSSSKTVIASGNTYADTDGNGKDAPARARDSLFMFPVQGKITQRFSSDKQNLHKGIDIAAPEGTKIVAARSGRVIWSRNKMPGYGNLIIIDHGGGYATVYAHNKKNLVHEDQYVRQGETIATVGQSGRATGPHVHFEIRKNTVCVDPMDYLR